MHPCSCKMFVPLQTFLVIVKIPEDSTLFFEQLNIPINIQSEGPII